MRSNDQIIRLHGERCPVSARFPGPSQRGLTGVKPLLSCKLLFRHSCRAAAQAASAQLAPLRSSDTDPVSSKIFRERCARDFSCNDPPLLFLATATTGKSERSFGATVKDDRITGVVPKRRTKLRFWNCMNNATGNRSGIVLETFVSDINLTAAVVASFLEAER